MRVNVRQVGHAGKRPICCADRLIHIVGCANKQTQSKQMNLPQLHAIYRYNCHKIHKSPDAARSGAVWHGASTQISSFNLLSIMKQLATFVATAKLLCTMPIIATQTTKTITAAMLIKQAIPAEARSSLAHWLWQLQLAIKISLPRRYLHCECCKLKYASVACNNIQRQRYNYYLPQQ